MVTTNVVQEPSLHTFLDEEPELIFLFYDLLLVASDDLQIMIMKSRSHVAIVVVEKMKCMLLQTAIMSQLNTFTAILVSFADHCIATTQQLTKMY